MVDFSRISGSSSEVLHEKAIRKNAAEITGQIIESYAGKIPRSDLLNIYKELFDLVLKKLVGND